jgi:hypothetical protein
MMKKLICFIKGHLWCDTGRDTGGDVDIVFSKCLRCGATKREMYG